MQLIGGLQRETPLPSEVTCCDAVDGNYYENQQISRTDFRNKVTDCGDNWIEYGLDNKKLCSRAFSATPSLSSSGVGDVSVSEWDQEVTLVWRYPATAAAATKRAAGTTGAA